MDFFKGRKVVIATKHKKEKVLQPLIESELGVNTFVPSDFDTDVFGTFTLDIKREGTALDALNKKVSTAMDIYDTDIAIASEGSFGPHPEVPFVNSNLELVMLLDKKNKIEIIGKHFSTNTNFNQKYVDNINEAIEFAESVGFPEHGVIVRCDEHAKEIYKDIENWNDFNNIVSLILEKNPKHNVFLETDMRAHRNPTRMKNIEKAGIDLIKNTKNTCPDCGTPGLQSKEPTDFLPCGLCGLKSEIPCEYCYICQKCDFFENRRITDDSCIDPGRCQNCNP